MCRALRIVLGSQEARCKGRILLLAEHAALAFSALCRLMAKLRLLGCGYMGVKVMCTTFSGP